MKYKSIPYTVLLIVYGYSSYSQNKKLDSLTNVYNNLEDGIEKVNTLQNLFNSIKNNDIDKAQEYVLEAYKLSEKINYKEGIYQSSFHLGSVKKSFNELDSSIYYFNIALKTQDKKLKSYAYGGTSDAHRLLGNYKSAIDNIEKALSLNRELKDSSAIGSSLINLSSIYRNQGNYNLAYIKILDALKIYENIKGKSLFKADCYKSIGEIEYNRGNYSEAIKNYKIALKTYVKENDDYYHVLTLNRIANSYIFKEDYKNARIYSIEALKLSNEKDFNSIRSISKFLLGEIDFQEGNYSKAKAEINEVLLDFRKAKNINEIYSSLLLLGKISIETNDFNKANKYLNEGLLISDTIKAPRESQEFYFYKSKLESKRGNYKNAHKYLELYAHLKDSLDIVNNSKEIEELKTIFESEKKEKEIAIQKNEIEILKQKQEISKKQRLLYILGLFSISILGGLLYFGVSQKLKRSKLEREKLDLALEYKRKELTSHALHLAKKNEVLEKLKQKVKELKENNSTNYNQLIQTINFDLQDDNNWENFKKYFEEVHTDFNNNVKQKYPKITSNELRLMALLKMNLTSKEIANILNISNDGIKKARYRLRKKLNLSTEDSLHELVINL